VKKICGNCKYCYQERGRYSLKCLRYPPHVAITHKEEEVFQSDDPKRWNFEIAYYRVEVSFNDSCGEFKKVKRPKRYISRLKKVFQGYLIKGEK